MPLTDVATITVQVGWANNPDDTSPTWSTVTPVESVQISPRGRHYELDTVQPTKSTIRVDNSDGSFAAGATISGGTVAPSRPIRIRAAIPTTTTTVINRGGFAAGYFGGGGLATFPTSPTNTVTTATYSLHTGIIEQSPTLLDSGGFDYASSTFTTVDYQDALAARTLQSCYNQQTIYENPTAYYPLNEAAGRTSVGDVIGGQVGLIRTRYLAGASAATSLPGYGLGATPFYGTSDTSTNLSLAPHFSAGVPDGAYMVILGYDSKGTYISGTTFAIRFTFATTYSDTSGYFFYQSNRITSGSFAGSDNAFYMGIGSNGVLTWNFPGTAAGAPATTYNDGYAHTVQIIGTATNTRIWVDGVLIATDNPVTTGALNNYGYLTVGGAITPTAGALATGSPYHGQIGHIAIWNNTQPADTTSYVNASNGFIGETANTRIQRVLNWVGYTGTPSLDSTCSTPLGSQASSGQSALQQCQDASNAEDGLFYIKGDGTPRLRSRASRYQLISVATFGSVTYPVETMQLEFQYDRQHMVNELYASRPDGPTIRVTDATSITKHRTRTGNVTFSVNTDDQLAQAANWYLYRYAYPVLRVGSITLRPYTTPSLATLACTLEPGDKITVTNLPAQAPASSLNFIVEAVSHTNISTGEWTVELSLSPWIAAATFDETSHYGYIDDYLTNPSNYAVIIY